MMNMEDEEIHIHSGYISGLKWSMTRLAKIGEQKCGDTYLITGSNGKSLIAAIDGLGHGESALRASQRAKFLLKKFSHKPIINLVKYCHEELRSTRGVVMNLALIDSHQKTLTWLGIGNVSGILMSADEKGESDIESVISRHGIVGYKLPSLQASMVPISMGDLLIFTTDGVRQHYLEGVNMQDSTDDIVKFIANNYLKRTDDALILVTRFTGEDNNGQIE